MLTLAITCRAGGCRDAPSGGRDFETWVVDLGGGQALVAEEFLHHTEVRSPFHEVRGEGVAQSVGCT